MGHPSATAPVLVPRWEDKPPTVLYAVTIFLSAFLLFQVQLLMGKFILPWFGGMPAVWNTCMLVYQVLLLGGYAYAHLVSRRLEARAQARLHLALLGLSLVMMAALALAWRTPLTPGPAWKPEHDANPVLAIMLLLGATIALPFFVLSTTGPLLQAWFSGASGGRSPYRLYALSNLGSLLGLLSYPFVVEPRLRLAQQAWMWTAGYALFLLCCGTTAYLLGRQVVGPAAADPPPAPATDAPAPHAWKYTAWLVFSFCGSVMLLATTNLISSEISVVPLLWVVPLCLYLASFILCFESDRWYRRGPFHLLYGVAAVLALHAWAMGPKTSIYYQGTTFCLALFAVCMCCHGELARLRPTARHLTSFYLTIAVGGALGGLFVVLLAPLIFHNVLEFHFGLVGCGVLVAIQLLRDRRSWLYQGPVWRPLLPLLGLLMLPYLRLLVGGESWKVLASHPARDALVMSVGLLVALVIVRKAKHPDFSLDWRWTPVGAFTALLVIAALASIGVPETSQVRLRLRNFFGVKVLVEDDLSLALRHGRILHGLQLKDPTVALEPSFYYRRKSGVGLLMDNYPRPRDAAGNPGGLRVGVIGLGTGGLSAYGKPGDYYRFYEIDPQVRELSFGPSPWFTFLRQTKAQVEIVMGDARLSLERELARGERQNFDILVLDAFTSDAIPAHLITREALDLYRQHLRGRDSVLVMHISNRAVDLRPVVRAISREYKLACVEVWAPFSEWVILAENPEMTRLPNLVARIRPVQSALDVPLWTDDFNNIQALLY